MRHVITYPCWDYSSTMLVKEAPGNLLRGWWAFSYVIDYSTFGSIMIFSVIHGKRIFINSSQFQISHILIISNVQPFFKVQSFWNCVQNFAVSMHWYCCALCKILKWLDSWTISYRQSRFTNLILKCVSDVNRMLQQPLCYPIASRPSISWCLNLCPVQFKFTGCKPFMRTKYYITFYFHLLMHDGSCSDRNYTWNI